MLDDENKVLNLLKVNQVWLTYSYVYECVIMKYMGTSHVTLFICIKEWLMHMFRVLDLNLQVSRITCDLNMQLS